MRLARQRQDAEAQGRLHLNLGHCHRAQQQLDLALQHYQHYLDWVRSYNAAEEPFALVLLQRTSSELAARSSNAAESNAASTPQEPEPADAEQHS